MLLKVVPPWYLNGWIMIPSAVGLLILLAWGTVFSLRCYDKRRKTQRLECETQALREAMFQQERTNRKILEEKNEALENALERAEWGTTTLRGVAHNLKNVAASIPMYCAALQSEAISDSTKSKAERIREIANRMVRSFQHLFEATGVPQVESFNLATMMDFLIAQVLPDQGMEKSMIQVHKQYENRLDIIADPEKIQLALTDIVTNAWEAMQEKGGTLTVKMFVESETVQIEIGDTGKGIPSADLEAVFNPRYTSKENGTGLGLWLARQIIEQMHQGHISIRSQEGIGTIVAIKLPENQA